MAENKDFAKRIASESKNTSRISNENLICKDCVSRVDDSKHFGNTSKCLKLGLKPTKVLLGGECSEYEKE
ncbi:MAG: hypothetical protein IIX37_07475 [Selenomonadaceae bacterium]|nr:hypothetical protein [Selenomonadaceae bacterium]